MWDTPFDDPSMLDGLVIIFCPDEENASELMGLLGEYGVRWEGSNNPASYGDNNWGCYREKTCYRISHKRMGYSYIDYYEQRGRFSDHTKCTFYGAGAGSIQDVEIGEEEFLAILNA